MSKLLPCPFCGGSAELVVLKDAKYMGDIYAMLSYVECGSAFCDASGPKHGCQSKDFVLGTRLLDLAVESWNHRSRHSY